jgi:calcineurin-like phosphoesterase family protein
MKTWIASDIHFNHRNILKYCPHRGGPDTTDERISAMNETIIRNWNSVVCVDDEVFILGDVAMGQMEKAPALIRQLNGKKRLIAGNHDKTLVKHIRAGNIEFQDLFVWHDKYHETSFAINGKKHMICMSHFPMSHWNGMNQGTIMLHGHLHGSPSGLTGRIKDVGIDTNNLMPYDLEKLVVDLLKIDVVRDHHGD